MKAEGGSRVLVFAVFVAAHFPLCSSRDSSHSTMTQYRNDFASFDANQDGILDAQEIRSQLEIDQEDNILAFFGHYDRDGSGTIGFHEYLTFALNVATVIDSPTNPKPSSASTPVASTPQNPSTTRQTPRVSVHSKVGSAYQSTGTVPMYTSTDARGADRSGARTSLYASTIQSTNQRHAANR